MTCTLDYSEFVDMFAEVKYDFKEVHSTILLIIGFQFLVHYPKKYFTFAVFPIFELIKYFFFGIHMHFINIDISFCFFQFVLF